MIDNQEVYNYEGHSVDFFTDKTISFLKEQENSKTPFFCFVPFNGPYGHWPAIKGRAKNQFAYLYDDCNLESVPREGLNKRVIERYSNRVLQSQGSLPEQFSGPLLLPNNKESLRNYFSQTSLIDHAVGRILNQLETLKLDTSTLVIYTSDHGFSLGNHGIWGHGLSAWPSSIHRPSFNIPLIFSGSGVSKGESEALVTQLDLPNTILKLANISLLGGKKVDSRPIDLSKPNYEHRDTVFMEQEETRALRTKKWLYIERFNKKDMPHLDCELFDLVNDKDERKDLSKDKKYLDIVYTLSKKLNSYFKKYSDPNFDLWNGGSAKSNVSNPMFWKKAWGKQWKCKL